MYILNDRSVIVRFFLVVVCRELFLVIVFNGAYTKHKQWSGKKKICIWCTLSRSAGLEKSGAC